VTDGFLPYGSSYDNVVNFNNLDDGNSDKLFFYHKFLFGCTFYRRFWVSFWP